MERDFVGYADTPPVVLWPDGARLAVQVSVSYEEGAEYSLLDGPRRETMGEVPSPVPPDRRDLFNESFFEYGSRVGVWRILACRAQIRAIAGITLLPIKSIDLMVVAWSMRDSWASSSRWPIPSSRRTRAKRSTTSSGVPATM